LTESNVEMFRGFWIHSQSWHADALLHGDYADQVVIGRYVEGGGCDCEFVMRWYQLGGASTPRLEMFGDSWARLSFFSDLLAALTTRGKLLTPQDLARILLDLGYRDTTQRMRSVSSFFSFDVLPIKDFELMDGIFRIRGKPVTPETWKAMMARTLRADATVEGQQP
jgi:hypothetical protein